MKHGLGNAKNTQNKHPWPSGKKETRTGASNVLNELTSFWKAYKSLEAAAASLISLLPSIPATPSPNFPAEALLLDPGSVGVIQGTYITCLTALHCLMPVSKLKRNFFVRKLNQEEGEKEIRAGSERYLLEEKHR